MLIKENLYTYVGEWLNVCSFIKVKEPVATTDWVSSYPTSEEEGWGCFFRTNFFQLFHCSCSFILENCILAFSACLFVSKIETMLLFQIEFHWAQIFFFMNTKLQIDRSLFLSFIFWKCYLNLTWSIPKYQL